MRGQFQRIEFSNFGIEVTGHHLRSGCIHHLQSVGPIHPFKCRLFSSSARTSVKEQEASPDPFHASSFQGVSPGWNHRTSRSDRRNWCADPSFWINDFKRCIKLPSPQNRRRYWFHAIKHSAASLDADWAEKKCWTNVQLLTVTEHRSGLYDKKM